MSAAPHKRGFSLIEMLVSVALFSMVVLMAVSALISLMNANQKARSLKTAMDNLNFAVDEMSRDLRLGTEYYCQTSASSPISIDVNSGNPVTHDCPYVAGTDSGGPYLEYRNFYGDVVLYRFDGSCLQEKVTDVPWGAYQDSFGSNSGYTCMTGRDITLSKVTFYVSNTAKDSGRQPFIIISMTGTVGPSTKPSLQTSFSLMTSISQRIPHNAE